MYSKDINSLSHTNKFCRIPTLSSKIPQVKPQTLDIKPPSTTSTITPDHLGSNVRVGKKEGVLRYVGGVNFAKGIWCGVELTNAYGKNNGTINGVRYFTCEDNRGLMTQACKVELLVENNSQENNASGPYSILCFPESLTDHKTNNCTYGVEQKNQNHTYNLLNGTEEQKRRTFLLDTTFDLRKQVLSSTSSVCSLPSLCNKTCSIEDLKRCVAADMTFQRSKACITFSAEHLDKLEDGNKRFVTSTGNNTPVEKGKEDLTYSKKRSNETFKQDDFLNNSYIGKSYDNLLEQSRADVKRRKVTSVNNSTPCKPNTGIRDLMKLRLSEISSEASNAAEESINKRDSLDCEESLGILTPDQLNNSFITLEASDVNLLEKWKCETLVNSCLSTQKKSPRSSFMSDHLNVRNDYLDEHKKQQKINNNLDLENENSKRDSLDYDVSLSILTAEQMLDFSEFSGGVLTPDQIRHFSDHNNSAPVEGHKPIIEAHQDFRCEETPSPEELPLDPTPIGEPEPPKNICSEIETSKSKASNSFITSITSITSLDTGYQGDGEMSRPASRGADNSPLTRRPFPRPLARKPDPLTDSDFYTESDADNHEDNQVKGDRRAQVIDGTLYSVDPQAAADIYVNNRENMDSSGVFTDLESGMRHDDEPEINNEIERGSVANNKTVDVSPSDSTKTISENSQQNNVREVLHQYSPNVNDHSNESQLDKTVKENVSKKRNAPSPGVSSPSSLASPRHRGGEEENGTKKYKTPKRDVASKVKALLADPVTSSQERKSIVKKPVNRWDAVMNKISKTSDQNKTNFKEIKSKVFDNLNNSPKVYEGAKKPLHNGLTPNNKSRRIRTRTPHTVSPLKKSVTTNVQSSIHSSLSDLSASGFPPKKTPGSVKKRDNIQVTQVLTPNKLSSKNQQNLNESKRNSSNIIESPIIQTEAKLKRTQLFTSKNKKQHQSNILKESNKSTVKGGRASPTVRPPVQQVAALKKLSQPRTVEALAVLVQHLVFNVEAYQVPHLRRQVEKLELALEEGTLKYSTAIEDEKLKAENYISELIEEHKRKIEQITAERLEAYKQLALEKDSLENHLNQKHDEQLTILRKELERLEKSHEGALDILREENDCMREQIDEKLRKGYETNENKLKEEIDALKSQRLKLEHQLKKAEHGNKDLQEKLKNYIEENQKLREQNDRLLGDDKDIAKQEVQSLGVVLELKQTEIAKLRKSLEEAKHRQEILSGAEEMAATLQARCEDLQHQLQRKTECEQSLTQENQRLQTYIKDELNHSRTISQQNEELKWKLRQNVEVFNKVRDAEKWFNRASICTSSFNENHNNACKSLERAYSLRESPYKGENSCSRVSRNSSVFEDKLSPPSSPKVKGVVEKSDSVSYVLDLDESPDQVASRILRRSFRNTTPTKSVSNKRPRFRTNRLSVSASSSAIVPANKEDGGRSRSMSARHLEDDDVFLWNHNPAAVSSSTPVMPKSDKGGDNKSPKLDVDSLDLDEDHDVDLELPALPSEMDKRNGVLTLPTPTRLADGSAASSDTNSEDDESCTSSSSQL